MVVSPEMGVSVNVLILANRRVTIEDFSGQMGISVGRALKFNMKVDIPLNKQNENEDDFTDCPKSVERKKKKDE